MIHKRHQEAKTGFELLKSMNAEKYLKKVGLGKEDYYFWKQIGKALLCTYVIFGAAWLYNETSPLGWWTLKPRPKEERELAHLYERREFHIRVMKKQCKNSLPKGAWSAPQSVQKGILKRIKMRLTIRRSCRTRSSSKKLRSCG